MKQESLDKLNDIIDECGDESEQMLIRNAFASACYFSMIGEDRASEKMLSKIFNHLGRDRRKTYFTAIATSMPEHAVKYARDIRANLELNKLFHHFEEKA